MGILISAYGFEPATDEFTRESERASVKTIKEEFDKEEEEEDDMENTLIPYSVLNSIFSVGFRFKKFIQ